MGDQWARQEEREARADEQLRVDDPDRERLAAALHDIDCGWNCPGHGVMQPVQDRRYRRMADVALRTLAGRLLPPAPEPLTVAIDVGTLKALVDLVTGSLDFGSGFLVDEDVDTLRTAAVVLGLDPMDVTPFNYGSRYPHDYEKYEKAAPGATCKYCGNAADWHAAERWVEVPQQDEATG